MPHSDPPRLPRLTDPPELYFRGRSLLRDLVLQLKKDFASAGIPVKLLLTKKYDFAGLVTVIEEALSGQHGQMISTLLYRVDISESQLKQGISTPGMDLQLLAGLIVKRELQKVVIRRMYTKAAQNGL